MRKEHEDDLYAWSTASPGSEDVGNTSARCASHLSLFFADSPSLAIATEASSHPSGIVALEWQPWTWAGGGLGNIAECPIQTCIAGAGIRRDSLTFASLCIVPQCMARDLVADDFLDVLENASHRAEDVTLASEYSNSVRRITELNKFLGTGWICGDFVVPWTLWPLGYVFIGFVSIFVLFVLMGSFCRRKRTNRGRGLSQTVNSDDMDDDPEKVKLINYANEEKTGNITASPSVDTTTSLIQESLLRSFDLFANSNELFAEKSTKTAVLDGLRVGSICWIMVGHVMAITGSVAGFSNPKEVFPPSGYLASFGGQLVLSSRFAVETFLIISGFLTFHVLNRKLSRRQNSRSVLFRYMTSIPKLFVARAFRVLPLYLVTLLFYTQIAPHMGGGPFWYQWTALLKPCHDYGWTNLLFVNNFVPFGGPTTETCFYHSWYLAVDMQLFLLSSVLVFWHQENPRHGKQATAVLWFLSMFATTFLAFSRRWSINTFDGAAVARYDAEAYAKPHVRAQSYLTGVFVAMILPDLDIQRRFDFSWKHKVLELLAVLSLVFVSFITFFGANSRRACQYQEWPHLNDCGSDWSETANWMYASFSQTIWCLSIGTLIHLFIGRETEVSAISSLLSLKVWVPLSRLSFAVYLVHPILIFMWELGSSEKEVFRPSTFAMNVLAVSVASYLVALVVVLFVEMPAANLLKFAPSVRFSWPPDLISSVWLKEARRTFMPSSYGSTQREDDEQTDGRR